MSNHTFQNRLILSLFIIICIIPNVSAINAEVASSLAPSLDENSQVNFTIIIDGLDQRTSDLTIKTDLVRSGNSPIFDFGDLNKYVGTSIYEQTVRLNLSSIPNNKTITVLVSGNTPRGETSKSIQDGLVLTRFYDGNLRYFEVENGEGTTLAIHTFKLNIKEKQQFEDTMEQIKWDELNPLKQNVRSLFDMGLVTVAQDMASDMSKIKSNLKLFNIIDIKNEFSLNLIVISIFLCGIIVGFIVRMKAEVEDD